MPYFMKFLVVYEIHNRIRHCDRNAFDTVRRDILLDKVADLDIPDNIHNWLMSYHTHTHTHHIDIDAQQTAFDSDQSHCTKQGIHINPAINIGSYNARTCHRTILLCRHHQ